MKKILIRMAFISSGLLLYAQEPTITVIDSLYREDQFYAGVTYNLLGNIPEGVSQNGFSGGYHIGFIRDMPINKNRNFALGLGIGLSANSYNQNMFINKDSSGSISFSLLEGSNNFSKNKFTGYLIECPLEIRWRTSTPSEYKFWRIYTGVKLGYVFAHSAKYKGDLGKIKHSNINEFNSLQYGLTLSVGYNTWNIHCYYGLNPIFSEHAQLNGSPIDMNSIKIGLMFYIL
ncbi:porin family protein [Aestuariivivens sp. NBU2969]|uniref:porin family protein n=1 Tax=Aestuariivivens sp. NBU2969 TaxID=2873267 RepID=UPI001CBD29D0|nr:porin family protein [Aestuariivivens sp. NBU2969]